MTVLACDIGGTRVKIGLVRDGALIADAVIPTQSGLAFSSQLDVVARELRTLCDQNGVALAACAGLGLSYPSMVDPVAARILDHFAKFPDAVGFDLRGWANEALHLPIAIENDARMALIGEWRYGVCRGFEDMVMITLGTGIGSAAVVQGRMVRGAHGQAGCLGGHLTIQLGGQPCPCGNVGCSEAEASTAALRRLAQSQTSFAGSALAREQVLDYAVVFRWSAAGDPCARSLANHSLHVWSVTAVNLVHAYDPAVVILGGGIMASGAVVLDAVRDYVHRHAHTPWGKVNVIGASLGDHAALLACEYLVKERCR